MMMIRSPQPLLPSRFRLVLLFSVAAGIMAGCGGKEETGEPLAEEIAFGVRNYPEVADKLASCNLVTPGKLGDAGPYQEEHCQLQCLLVLRDCDTMTEVFCSTTKPAASERAAFEGCVSSCLHDLEMFTCSDGTAIAGELHCNGQGDCSGGEDEQGCGTVAFSCDGNKVYPVTSVCNGVRECSDGADEPAGCVASRCAEH